MHLTQPAVSGQIKRLEEAVGAALFDRTARGMALTEAGRAWRPWAERALASIAAGRDALDAIAGLERGALSIGGGATATTYLLPAPIGRFHARYPDVHLYVREQGSEAVLTAVAAGDLDLGIVTLGPEPGAPRGVRCDPWIEDDLRLIVPERHRLRARRTFRWPEIDGEPAVLFEAGSAVRAIIDERLGAHGVRVRPVMELRSIESIKQMVAHGVGAAFVSRFALGSEERGLRAVPGGVARRLAIARRADREPSRAAAAFLEELGAGASGG